MKAKGKRQRNTRVKSSRVIHQEIIKEERRRKDLTAAITAPPLKMKKRKGTEGTIIERGGAQSDQEEADMTLLNLTKD